MKILHSPLLEQCDGVVHGFAHDPKGFDLSEIASDHALKSIVTVKQVHGNSVFFADRAAANELPQADSVVSTQAAVGVGVVTADCVPVLICFPDFGCVCAVHAGWRGTLLRVVRKCLDAVCERFSLKPQDAVAAVGPAIGKCCYEVRDDVASRFISKFGRNHGEWLLEKDDGKFLLDIVRLNALELLNSGVSKIDTIEVCTCCRGLPSYRREGSSAQRMISFIGISR